MSDSCKICEKKRARRRCPGIVGDICPTCCGAGRENTIDCPFECEHLQEARSRELPTHPPGDPLPNQDLALTDELLHELDREIMALGRALARAMDSMKAVDNDAHQALDALIRTYRTLESGLIYETRPQNPYAAAIQDKLKESIEELRKSMMQESGMHTLRDADILRILVFLQNVEISRNNGRPRGRAFSGYIRLAFAEPEAAGFGL